MVQSIDSSFIRPIYNGVDIKIRKPQVNTKDSSNMSVVNDNGIYNAVRINIDNPRVNSEHQKVYEYPEADHIVTYEMTGFMPVSLPERSLSEQSDKPKEVDSVKVEEVEVPKPNYTTTEDEKGAKIADASNVQFHGAPENKKVEIVPGEEIKPEIDVHKIVSNLENKDYDVQAKQMAEIARTSLENPEKAVPYIVKEIFAGLVDIAKNDTKALAAPTKDQVEARKKLIMDFVAMQKNPNLKEMPYKLTDNEVALATTLSPMEMAERNKEYALYTMAILAKVYIDEVHKHTGNVVPMTDVPGVSVMVDSLRYSQNPGVKIAAIDALSHIARPEYKDEMKEIFTIAKSDRDRNIAAVADLALQKVNKQ